MLTCSPNLINRVLNPPLPLLRRRIALLYGQPRSSPLLRPRLHRTPCTCPFGPHPGPYPPRHSLTGASTRAPLGRSPHFRIARPRGISWGLNFALLFAFAFAFALSPPSVARLTRVRIGIYSDTGIYFEIGRLTCQRGVRAEVNWNFDLI